MPGPTAFDFGFERKTEEGPNHDDSAKQADAFEGQRGRDRRDDVGADEKLKSQQNAAPEIRAILLVGGPPLRPTRANWKLAITVPPTMITTPEISKSRAT